MNKDSHSEMREKESTGIYNHVWVHPSESVIQPNINTSHLNLNRTFENAIQESSQPKKSFVDISQNQIFKDNVTYSEPIVSRDHILEKHNTINLHQQSSLLHYDLHENPHSSKTFTDIKEPDKDATFVSTVLVPKHLYIEQSDPTYNSIEYTPVYISASTSKDNSYEMHKNKSVNNDIIKDSVSASCSSIIQCNYCSFNSNDATIMQNHDRFCKGGPSTVTSSPAKRKRKNKNNVSNEEEEESLNAETSERLMEELQRVVDNVEKYYFRDVTSMDCFLCHYKCTSDDSTVEMFNHLEKYHFKLSPYKCEICHVETVSHCLMLTHQTTHTSSSLDNPADTTDIIMVSDMEDDADTSDSDGELPNSTLPKSIKLKSLICRLCTCSFRTFISLHRHLRRRHKSDVETFSCHGCSYTATNLPTIIRHKRKCKGERIFKCFICFTKLDSIEDLVRHIAVTEAKYPHKCLKCSAPFARLKLLYEHVNEKHDHDKTAFPQIKECIICSSLFNSSEALESHFKTHTNDAAFLCPLCGGRFGRLVELKNHIWRHAPEILRCKFCSYISISSRILTRHVECHKGVLPYHCLQCNSVFDYRKDIEDHLRQHEILNLKCTICGIKTYHADTMQLHLLLHHRPKSSNITHICPLCIASSNSETEILQHFETHMNMIQSTQYPPVDHPQSLSCQDCNHNFQSLQCLRYHQHLHRQEKVFQCSQCRFVTGNRMVLDRHFRIHSGEKPFKCKYCDYCSGDQTTLRRHLRKHGEGKEKRFKCPKCDFKVHEKFSLKRHIARHERYNPLKCSECDFRCVHKGTLTKHLRRKHKSVKNLQEAPIDESQPLKINAIPQNEQYTYIPIIQQPKVQCEETFQNTASTIQYEPSLGQNQIIQVNDECADQTLSSKNRTSFCNTSYIEPSKEVHVQYINDQTVEVSDFFNKSRNIDSYNEAIINYQKTGVYKFTFSVGQNFSNQDSEDSTELPSIQPTQTTQEGTPTAVVSRESSDVLFREGYTYTKPVSCTDAIEGGVTETNLNEKQCKTCLLLFDCEENLQKHFSEVHPKDYQFVCTKCNYRFSEKKFLVRHKNSHKDSLKCYYCSYSTYSKRSMINHTRLHTGDRPFVCYECHQRFADKSSLSRHTATHNEANALNCEFCGFVCYNKNRLATHVKRHYTANKTYKCSQCDYRSFTKGMVTRHFIKHTGEKPYACDHCDFRASDQTVMRRHLLRHNNKEKSIQCPKCDYKCHEANHLKKHMKSHDGPLPFACMLCDFRCNYKGTLTKHIRKHGKTNA